MRVCTHVLCMCQSEDNLQEQFLTFYRVDSWDHNTKVVGLEGQAPLTVDPSPEVGTGVIDAQDSSPFAEPGSRD